jgi:hypothetical protein
MGGPGRARGALAAFGALLLAAGAEVPGADRGIAAGDMDAGRQPERQDGGRAVGCAEQRDSLLRRKAWLAARRQEQIQRGGFPDPSKGIPNMVAVFCEGHPKDADCALEAISITVTPDEVAARPDATPDDYDPHVILMKRDLARCRADAGLE